MTPNPPSDNPAGNRKSPLLEAIDEAADALDRAKSLCDDFDAACQLLADCWAGHGKLLIAGNGGSAADAMHFAEELVVRYQKNRRAFAAIALTDPTVLTCCGNDFGYEKVFARQVEALGRPGDVLVVFSTSGNSPNCVAAVDEAKKAGLRSLAFLGKDGGALKGQCDVEFLVPSDTTARIQEVHQLLYHAICQWVDQNLG
ncbi:MAG: SIS domain-containing protein [Phycisphaerae bacterium]